ncbi:hypothetical protein ACFSHQ_16855 [Gemmobacter lanyuensis]
MPSALRPRSRSWPNSWPRHRTCCSWAGVRCSRWRWRGR